MVTSIQLQSFWGGKIRGAGGWSNLDPFAPRPQFSADAENIRHSGIRKKIQAHS